MVDLIVESDDIRRTDDGNDYTRDSGVVLVVVVRASALGSRSFTHAINSSSVLSQSLNQQTPQTTS